MAQARTSSVPSTARRRKRKTTRQRKTWPNGRPMSLIEEGMEHINRSFRRWIKKYPGEYVVILGNRIIAHGNDLDEVSDRSIEKAGDKAMSTVLYFVPECIEDTAILL